MNSSGARVCTICGGKRSAEDRWFLLAETPWDDKLRVLRWSAGLAATEGMYGVCSPLHVRELVVHWMTTGSLDYPFARTELPLAWRAQRLGSMAESNCAELDASRLGELAVHRESVARALSEDPQSLNVILDELLMVLRREAGEISSEVEAEDEMLCAPSQEM